MPTSKNKFLEVRYVECIPHREEMVQGVIYVSRKYQTAAHLCACGCGNESVTPLGCSHGWDFKVNGTKVTLSPSILNTNCPNKAHYFIRKNEIEWV